MARVWRFGDNIDTDQILPGRYAPYMTSEADLGKYPFVEARPEFVQQVQRGDIIVAGSNFGCGSSREYAPRALVVVVIAAIIAPSYSRIFYRNALNLGLPLFVLDLTGRLAEGQQVELDLLAPAIRTGEGVATDLFKRGGQADIARVLARTSAADVTEALHNTGAVEGGIRPIVPGARMAGRVLTVWTYPGDWAKPVEAIDHEQEGDVLVIDAGGRPPAVWGEKATMSCIQRKLAGVVIYGAIRDTMNIRQMNFPAFANLVTPVAGEPKGQGMIGVPLNIGGQYIRTGDWIAGDDDGLVVIPQERAVEVANRAQTVVEREDREMAEIQDGSTLGKVSELMRWEQLRKGDDGKEDQA